MGLDRARTPVPLTLVRWILWDNDLSLGLQPWSNVGQNTLEQALDPTYTAAVDINTNGNCQSQKTTAATTATTQQQKQSFIHLLTPQLRLFINGALLHIIIVVVIMLTITATSATASAAITRTATWLCGLCRKWTI